MAELDQSPGTCPGSSGHLQGRAKINQSFRGWTKMCLENEDVLVASISVKEYLPLCPVLSLAAPQWWQIPGMGSHSGLAVRSGSEMEKTGEKLWNCCCCWPCPCFALAVTSPGVNYNHCLSVNMPFTLQLRQRELGKKQFKNKESWIKRLFNKKKSIQMLEMMLHLPRIWSLRRLRLGFLGPSNQIKWQNFPA